MTRRSLEATNLDLQYGKVQVLFDVSIAVERGEFVALLGTNGAGKSTFLKAVSNLSGLTAGRVDLRRTRTSRAGRRTASPPPASPTSRAAAASLPDLTVDENLRLGGHLLRGRGKRAEFDAGLDYAYSLFGWMSDAAQAAGGHAVGRRAADAGHRPRRSCCARRC